MHFDSTYLEALFARYLKDPSSVDPQWHSFFETKPTIKPASSQDVYRLWGHLSAHINPLTPPPLPPITLPVDEKLHHIYCTRIGFEFKGGKSPQEEEWLQERIEKGIDPLSSQEKNDLLHALSRAELFEKFLHTKYVGQKRFSLEGAETLIAMVRAFVMQEGLLECIIGMPHRGRLNVLVNILGKSYAQVFHEFEDALVEGGYSGSGDVKYHRGFSAEVGNAKVLLVPNPSHLESVDPVVMGEVYARQVVKGQSVQGLLIHGDASLSGQGVVYETLQLMKTAGYGTGGSVHIVVNNQIGFTTVPRDYKSGYYCTDIARAFDCPVFHVNAEDPEGSLYAMRLAIEYRKRWQRDVWIELVCYRRYGHNESDEPSFTQPIEYRAIKAKESIATLYGKQLVQEGVLTLSAIEEIQKKFHEQLQLELTTIQSLPLSGSEQDEPISFEPVRTALPFCTLKEMAAAFSKVPQGFCLHRKIKNLIQERLLQLEGSIDWGMAEHLAFASLVWEKIDVRLSGQDCRRGTFSHRHALWVDQETGRRYVPLSHMKEGQARFDVFNSPLSEFAVLGFEYGYSLANPQALVIWEAQFGDFANAAQVVTDQYLMSGEKKWARASRLVLLLPHGYEGQGPEHSSARIERFLQLCADDNAFVVNPTTPANFFHLLRRQALWKIAKPLIVFTPKSLLRHPLCKSPIQELQESSFLEIIDDPSAPKEPHTLVFCCGHIYYDLVAERKERKVAIVRIEQLYPIEIKRIQEIVKNYPTCTRFLWVQEEPKNMGAWHFIQDKLCPAVGLEYVGRDASASTATGSLALHQKEHQHILRQVFDE